MDDPKSDNENSIREENESFSIEGNGSENSDVESSEEWNIDFDEGSQFWKDLQKKDLYIYLKYAQHVI